MYSMVVFSLATPSLKTLTKKPAVRQLLEEGVTPTDFSEITVGMQLTGWIRNILDYGVFVEFPHGLVGLAPKSVSEWLFAAASNLHISHAFLH